MYPRNAASPPRIAIGAVVQISDGAVQSSGVSVVVRAEGGSETAGGGTVSYGASSSVVYYAPTQAETNHTAFVVTAYKTGCIPVSQTVVTTANATAGRVSVGDVAGTAQTGADLGAALGTAQADLDTLTGSDGVTLATSQPNYAPATAAALATVDTNVDTLLTRITSTLFSGITSLAEWLGALAGKQAANATAQTEIRATGAGSGTYDATTDSQEAIRDRGDAAWATATGFSTHSAADVWAAATRTLTANTNLNDLDAAAVTSAVLDALDTAIPATPTVDSINDVLQTLDGLLPVSGTLSTLNAAAVNAEVVDALATDTYAEPGSVPAATASLAAKIGWLYILHRNKLTQTSTTMAVRNDADSGNVGTSTHSDDGTTYTRGEFA